MAHNGYCYSKMQTYNVKTTFIKYHELCSFNIHGFFPFQGCDSSFEINKIKKYKKFRLI